MRTEKKPYEYVKFDMDRKDPPKYYQDLINYVNASKNLEKEINKASSIDTRGLSLDDTLKINNYKSAKKKQLNQLHEYGISVVIEFKKNHELKRHAEAKVEMGLMRKNRYLEGMNTTYHAQSTINITR